MGLVWARPQSMFELAVSTIQATGISKEILGGSEWSVTGRSGRVLTARAEPC